MDEVVVLQWLRGRQAPFIRLYHGGRLLFGWRKRVLLDADGPFIEWTKAPFQLEWQPVPDYMRPPHGRYTDETYVSRVTMCGDDDPYDFVVMLSDAKEWWQSALTFLVGALGESTRPRRKLRRLAARESPGDDALAHLEHHPLFEPRLLKEILDFTVVSTELTL